MKTNLLLVLSEVELSNLVHEHILRTLSKDLEIDAIEVAIQTEGRTQAVATVTLTNGDKLFKPLIEHRG